jgi:hypothetical protein
MRVRNVRDRFDPPENSMVEFSRFAAIFWRSNGTALFLKPKAGYTCSRQGKRYTMKRKDHAAGNYGTEELPFPYPKDYFISRGITIATEHLPHTI